ncbi:MAG TPA: SRPBCC domain-containing protein [Nakamurella sp.]
MSERPVGLTREAGFEIGVSRTVDIPLERIWDILVSGEGTRTWLGDGVNLPAERGTTYRTTDGTAGEIRSFHPNDRVRLTWRPDDWDHESIVQVTVSSRGGRTVVRFHQERLADPDERERQRAHWRGVLDELVDRMT